jgi:hypothetical protein
MCLDDDNFVYPNTLELSFNNAKEGLYLLDDGLAMYLFVAKYCDESLMKSVFGKSKFANNEQLK